MLYLAKVNFGAGVIGFHEPEDRIAKIVDLLVTGNIDGLISVLEIDEPAGTCRDATKDTLQACVDHCRDSAVSLPWELFNLAQHHKLIPIWACALEDGELIDYQPKSRRAA
jgi:hypothetical protein